ncbi:MAG: GvpL/GvpF family gas vesicle protein, partial [Acidobacteria bacterium]|nr:GvpL/GvpF family gas vesicle protein [Acidobacteriota bacterium]
MASRVKSSGKARAEKKPVARASPSIEPRQDSRRVLYVYGISRSARPVNLTIPEGVDGLAPVEMLRVGGMSCWISRVDRGQFADQLSENMENLEWLASAGVRHQRVVGAIAAAIDVLPARFGTVFLSEAGLQEDIESRKAALQESLDRITGTEEWGVKVFAGERSRVAVMPARSGKEYLQKKAKL